MLGDVYLNNALSGIVEAAAYLICAFTIDRFSRKKLLAGCLLVGGTFCLVSTVFNHFAAGKIGNVVIEYTKKKKLKSKTCSLKIANATYESSLLILRF